MATTAQTHPAPRASQNDRIVRFLGGKKTLGSSPASHNDFIAMIRGGLPYRTLLLATEHLQLSVNDLSLALGLSPRTLARRRSSQRLTTAESERILRLARVVARAEEVLGDAEAARGWLQARNRALGGTPPIEFLDTDIGADAVLDILGRIEHGVFS